MEPDVKIPSPLPPGPIFPSPSVGFYSGEIGEPRHLPTFREFLREWLRATVRRVRRTSPPAT